MERKVNREEIANPEEIPLLDDLECTIDIMISLNPYICSKCENVFCQDCVVNWTKKSSNCPMRCSPFNYSLLENSILKTQINKIKLFCGNKSSGCKETCLVSEKEKHEKNCEYASVQCGKCKKFVPQKLLNEHYFKACEKMKIKCFVCQENFSVFDFLNLHLDFCFKNVKYCEFCFGRLLTGSSNVKNKNAEKEHFSNCECKVDICKVCEMPELASKIEYTHKHESLNNENNYSDEMITIHVCNFYKLMNSIDEKFNFHLNAFENEKEFLMKNALEVFEFIAKNQNKILNGIENIIKLLKKEEDDLILKLKAERMNENKELEKEILELENKITKTGEEIKNLNWIVLEQKAIMDSKSELILKRKTDNINNLLLIYSQLKNLKSIKENSNSANYNIKINNIISSNNNIISSNKNNNNEILSKNDIFNDINNYMITEEEENPNTQSLKNPNQSSNIIIDDNNNITNNNIIKNDNKSFKKQDSLFINQINQKPNCFKCGGNTEIKNCAKCKKHICINCIEKCVNKNKPEHQSNVFCKDCVKACYLCGINVQCTQCVRKCFNKNCNFYFCQFCFEKNKHQQRPENTNCKFYKCESCNNDGRCIMATIYCSSCDVRVCRDCLQKSHIGHVNFK